MRRARMKIRYGRGDYIFTLCKYTECAIFGMRKRIVATLKDDERRIISAWRAEPHERRYYWKNIEGDE